MEVSDGRFYTIGDLARRTGLPARTIRFWSYAGIVPETRRSPAGHRLYDDSALARLELVVTLRQLGLGLDTVRAVLENRTTVAVVAELHARALETEIKGLKLRRAVLLAVAKQGLDMEEMRLVSDLAGLSAAERKRLVDDFIADTFGGVEDKSGIGERKGPRLEAQVDSEEDQGPQQQGGCEGDGVGKGVELDVVVGVRHKEPHDHVHERKNASHQAVPFTLEGRSRTALSPPAGPESIPAFGHDHQESDSLKLPRAR